MPDIAVEFVHFNHPNFGDRVANRFDRFAEGLDPVIDGNVADLQKTAYGAEPHAFQIQLQGLSPDRRTHPAFGHGVPINTAFAAVALPAIDDAVLDAALAVAFWTIYHQIPIRNGEVYNVYINLTIPDRQCCPINRP